MRNRIAPDGTPPFVDRNPISVDYAGFSQEHDKSFLNNGCSIMLNVLSSLGLARIWLRFAGQTYMYFQTRTTGHV